jgi:hypothetical protein
MENIDKNIEGFTLNDAEIILQTILNKAHHDSERRTMKKMSNRTNVACPVCGDSHDEAHKKRGNLYHKNLFYKCYNCDWRGSILQLLSDFDVKIDPKKKLQMVDYVTKAMDSIKFDEDEFISKKLDKLIDIEDLTDFFNNPDNSAITPITNFRPIQKGSTVHKYLTDRTIYNYDNMYEGTYWITPTWSQPVMINMNMSKGKVAGIQTRNLLDRENRIFKVFKFSELWDYLNPNEPLDDIEEIGYNKLSYLYGILNVNWERPITVFEGFVDTKFFYNSIGCVGTNTDLNILLTQDVELRFLYDHDKTGIIKSKKLLKQGHSVFLWDRFFKNWASKKNNTNKAYRKLKENVVDLNNVANILNNPSPYKVLDMEGCFSYDEFDSMYITNADEY